MSVASRYLKRLGVARPASLDLAALQTLLTAHLQTIPFENVTSFLGEPVSLEPEHVFAKMLEGGRGGYCMEHALLTRTALGELGFNVESRLARVLLNPSGVGARTHGATAVHLGGQTYIFDPGFGGYTPTIPVSLDCGDAEQPAADPGIKYRVRLPAAFAGTDTERLLAVDATHVYEQAVGDKWTAYYSLTSLPVVDADTNAFNWFVSTHPSSVFVSNIMVAARSRDRVFITGFNRNFKRRRGADVEDAVLNSEADVDRWMRGELGLSLTDAQVAGLWAKLSTTKSL